MNYAKIKKEYPKAYTLLDRLYKDRDLYDFFYKHGYWITIDFSKVGGEYDKVNMWNCVIINIEDDTCLHEGENMITPIEAEEAGFEKCFEILERKLQ